MTNIKKKAFKKPRTKGVARVSVVIQLEALECGAACLRMILAYYNKWVLLEQVRANCGVSRDGSKASNILKAARNYGLLAKGYRYEPNTLREVATYPCIIHWNFNHFVVLNGFMGDKAYITDPAKGTYNVTMEEFDKAFTGVCMLFEPSECFIPSGKQRSVFSFVKKRMVGTAGAVTFVILASITSSLFGLINPAFSRIFLDRLLTGKNPEWLYPFIIALSLLTLLTLMVSFVQTIYNFKLSGKLSIIANSKYLWHVLRMPMKFFSQRMAGDIAMRQSLNEDITNSLINMIAPLFLNTIMMIFYFVVMMRYSLLLTAVGAASIFINLLMASIISKERVNINRVQMRDAGKLASSTVSGIEMIETIKSSGAENGFFEKWAGYQAGMSTQAANSTKINHYLGMIPTIISSLSSITILMIGVYLTIQNQFTVGMILAFQGLLGKFTAPAQSIISVSQSLTEMRTNIERIEDVMEYPTNVEYTYGYDEDEEFSKLSGTVVLKDVSFGYSSLDAPLIRNFNLNLTPGSSVAFVGFSGCGKSTLSKLISGLYNPWSGEILFDGKSILEIDRRVFTGSVAVVDQDITLFEDTISNNIKMWDTSIEDFEVIMAARDACLHEDIMERDGGYSYKITEGGTDLSGGQRQCLELARVLAQDPTIIILDEATSALDAKTEFKVVNAIKARGITCIVIAHRLSTIRDCDEIIVLDKGNVVERGTHAELYEKGGLYTQLVTNE